MTEELQVKLIAKDLLTAPLGKAAAAMKGLQDASEQLKTGYEGLSDEQKELISGLGSLGGEALRVAGAAAVSFGGEVNRAMGQVAASTGLAGKELEVFRDMALDIYEGGAGESVEAVAGAMSQVERQTHASRAELKGLTLDALTLESVFGSEVNESTRAVRQMMVNLGVDGQHAFDLITVAMQQTGDPADDLLDTINEYSAVFAEAGFSADEMAATLVAGMEAGAFNADKLGDTVNEFMTRLTDGTDTTRIALDTLTGSADEFLVALDSGSLTGKDALGEVIAALQEIESPLERDQTAVALFGSLWEDLGPTAILALGDIEGGLGDVEGATQRAGEAMQQGPEAALERLRRTGLTMLTPLVDGVNSLHDSTLVAGLAVAGLGKAAVTAAGGTEALAVALGTTQLALGAVALAAGSVILAYEKYKDLQATIAKGQEQVNTALGEWSGQAAEMRTQGKSLNEVALTFTERINESNQTLDESNALVRLAIDEQEIQADAIAAAEEALRTEARTYDEYVSAVQMANVALGNRDMLLEAVSASEFAATNAVAEEAQARANSAEAARYAGVALQEQAHALAESEAASRSASAGQQRLAAQADAAAAAQKRAAQAAAEQAETTADLAMTLKDATGSQIASQMIGMLDPEKMGATAYSQAVAEIGLNFGLMDEKSIALAGNMGGLAQAIEEGIIPTEDVDEALQYLITDAEDGTVIMDDLLGQFEEVPGKVGSAARAFRESGTGLAEIEANAPNAASGIASVGQQFHAAAPEVAVFSTKLGTTQDKLEALVAGSPWTLTVVTDSDSGTDPVDPPPGPRSILYPRDDDWESINLNPDASKSLNTLASGARAGVLINQLTIDIGAALGDTANTRALANLLANELGSRLKLLMA